MDRRQALVRGATLPDRADGATLFADISGFTPLTEALVNALGPQRGAEELPRHLNLVYEALIAEVQHYGGSVIGFSGDAITCWFDGDTGIHATACALAMQVAMRSIAKIEVAGSATVELAMKAAIATGPVRRFVVGDPEVQWIDVLAGHTVDRVAAAERHAQKGEVLLDPQSAAALADLLVVTEWRDGYAVVAGLSDSVTPVPWPPLDLEALPEAEVRPWLLAPVYERLQGGHGEFLAELRPAVALFLRFGGIDYDQDEAAGQKLDGYIRWVQSILSRYEGSLIQVTMGEKGSYLYAAFGAPIAHEDDAERAVAAALELRTPPTHLDFIREVQLGISRGRMRTGAYGGKTRRTYGVLGDEVNVAARLMSQAQPGQILVSQRIVYATRQRYIFHPLGLLSVRGKQEGVPVALLLDQRRPSLQRPATLFAHPLVGREQELERIKRLLSMAHTGAGQILRIEGVAGVGKSHLTAEVVERALALPMRVVIGNTQGSRQRTPYGPWRQLFRALLGLSEEPPRGEPSARWITRQIAQLESLLLQGNPEWRLRLPLLGDLLGLPIPDNATTSMFDPPTRQNALFTLVVEMVQSWAQRQPLLIALEDVHWMDEASLALTLTVSRAMMRHPIMLLLIHRPRSRQEMPLLASLARLRYHHHLALSDLDLEGIKALVKHRLRGASTRLALDLIQIRAQGNPFFTEELVDMLHESGALRQREDGRWDLSDPLTTTLLEANCLAREHGQGEWALAPYAHLSAVELGLPDSVHGVVLSRLDRLPEAHKLTLKVASVIGRTFTLPVLAHAHPLDLAPATLEAQIDHAASRDFVRLETPAPHVTYLFKHNITQEVAYGTLLYDQRRRLHRAVAEWYEQSFAPSQVQNDAADPLAPHYPILVHHWHHAEDEARERHYAILAGRQAAAQFANEEAISYLSRALLLTPEDAVEERYRLLLTREAVHHLRGAREAQAQDLDSLEGLALALGDNDRQATVALRRAIFAEATGEYSVALAAAQQAVTLAMEASQLRLELEGYNRWGWVVVHQGNYPAATELFERALALAPQAAYPHGEGDALCGLG
ncbi:MAG: AAA family ATPase, partial [Ardenticatenales bacterium]|nr:AAA family ATPase [Ardenticatenales bacterium]